MDARQNTTDRRRHEHRRSTDRRTGPIPRLVPRDVAIDAAAQAMALGEALAAERIRIAAEWKLAQS